MGKYNLADIDWISKWIPACIWSISGFTIFASCIFLFVFFFLENKNFIPLLIIQIIQQSCFFLVLKEKINKGWGERTVAVHQHFDSIPFKVPKITTTISHHYNPQFCKIWMSFLSPLTSLKHHIDILINSLKDFSWAAPVGISLLFLSCHTCQICCCKCQVCRNQVLALFLKSMLAFISFLMQCARLVSHAQFNLTYRSILADMHRKKNRFSIVSDWEFTWHTSIIFYHTKVTQASFFITPKW